MNFRPYEKSDFDSVWQAFDSGNWHIGKLGKIGKLEFSVYFSRLCERYTEVTVVENEKLLALVFATFNGWRYEPHVEVFAWASKKEILSGFIDYFKSLSKQDKIGVIVVKSLESSKNLFDHVCRRNVLSYVGQIPKGDYRGTEYIYTATGNAEFPTGSTRL